MPCWGVVLLSVLWCLSLCVSSWAEDIPFESYVETLPQGRIDWDRGVVYGVGKGYPHLNQGSRAKALRAGQALALQSILKVASGVQLDDRETLETLGASGRVEIRLSALVHYEEHETEWMKDVDPPYVRVTYKAPLKGVEGLTRRLITELRGAPSAWDRFPVQEPPTTPLPGKEQPWLVVDARSLPPADRVQPALFPRIQTAEGRIVYDLDRVTETSLVERGMARYVVLDPRHDALLAAGPAFLSRLRALLSPSAAWAQDKKRRKRGGGYVITGAQAAQGLKKTNLVISEEDAKRIQESDASNGMLKECRVIVIVSGTVGGIEGQLYRTPTRYTQASSRFACLPNTVR
ncbi:MAG: hypothetical protein PVG49_07750 [Desulfobacteraceae bacterium]